MRRRRYYNDMLKRSIATSCSAPKQVTSWKVLLSVLPIFSYRAVAQKTSATCTPDWNWVSNQDGESPCIVAAQLLSLCNPKPSTFELGSGKVYTPSADSSVSLTPNTCSCNVVTYNLLMACQACQKGSSLSDIPSWADYSKTCSICSTETGMAPGPCGQQASAGFPSSVHPAKGSIAVPLWAIENTSGSKWNPSAARKTAANGGQKIIESPNIATADKATAADGKGKSASSTESKQGMKGAVIACSCLAALILLCFSIYLVRLWLLKRKERRMRDYGDTAFDKVVPAPNKRDSHGVTTPLKMNFRNMVARLTIALPKTPVFPKTPRTPGLVEKMPSTPLTARFWNFGKRDTKKLSIGDETEYLAEKSVRFEGMPGYTPRLQKTVSKRCDSMASTYSDFDSYRSASSREGTPRPGSVASIASARSKETLTTGVVKVDRPKLRETKRVDSLRPTSSSVPHEPFRQGSQGSSVEDHGLATSLSKSLPKARVRSQSVKVGEWSDRASMISQESRKSTKSSKNTKETAARSRSASISEVENASIRDSNSSIRDSNLPRESRRTKSTGSRSRLNSGTSSDFEGSLSESEQRETIQFPDELKAKQREASERFSVASSAASSTMDKSTGRMQELFKTATENLHQSNKGISNAEEEVDDAADDTKRASGVTVSSNSSNMRRLDSVIGQLEFDEMMSSYGSPTKKSWLARMSTKSGKSGPPPSPAFSTAPGFAM